jgi:ABC-type multidrug transport system ATPase subunit
MLISLTNIGKRYNYEWIFRKITLELNTENNYVILGSNGSGKSTLLQLLSGSLVQSEGEIKYNSGAVSIENIFRHVSYAAPYIDLYEDFTLSESVNFHSKFKPFSGALRPSEVIQLMELEKASDKQLKYFSSGMKQRVKLALAILSDTPLLLLDEPASNLDRAAISWYQQLIKDHSSNRLIIVASNQQEPEYVFCNKQISISDYK